MTSMLQSRTISLPGTQRKPRTTSHGAYKEELEPLTPCRSSVEKYGYVPHRNSSVITRGADELDGLEYECVGFRTPQRPASGTNRWGGPSPLISSNVPLESLELEYLRFGTGMGGEYEEAGGCGRMKRRFWGFGKSWWRRKKVVLGSRRRTGWMSKKWPQGW